MTPSFREEDFSFNSIQEVCIEGGGEAVYEVEGGGAQGNSEDKPIGRGEAVSQRRFGLTERRSVGMANNATLAPPHSGATSGSGSLNDSFSGLSPSIGSIANESSPGGASSRQISAAINPISTSIEKNGFGLQGPPGVRIVDCPSPITPVENTPTGGLTGRIKQAFGSLHSLGGDNNNSKASINPKPSQPPLPPLRQSKSPATTINQASYSPADADGFSTSTPLHIKHQGRKVTVSGLFKLHNHLGFELNSFRNRHSKFYSWKGFPNFENIDLVNYKSGDAERINFLHSKFGDIASNMDEHLNYHVFGIKSYLKVVLCPNCKRGKASHNHHLEKLLDDLEMNKNFKGEVCLDHIDINRDFSLVVRQESPRFTVRPSYSRKISGGPAMCIVPTRDLPSAHLSICEARLDDDLILSLNSFYFGYREILGDLKNGFSFNIREQTPRDSIILPICSSNREMVTDKLVALQKLLDSCEPKMKLNETLNSAGYALWCLYYNFRFSRDLILDPVFNFDNLNLPMVCFDFGRIKEELMPLGIYMVFIRAYVEDEIKKNLKKLKENLKSEANPHFDTDHHGLITLSDRSESNLRDLIECVHFPPISEDNNTARGEFLYFLGRSLRGLPVEVLVEMGLPVDICEKLNLARQVVENQFLSKKGVLTDNGVDSLTSSLSGSQFVRDIYNRAGSFYGSFGPQVGVATPAQNFDIFHDSWVHENATSNP